QPTAWGSGGGRCSPVATAGSGGGTVRLSVAGVLTVDGQLSANGTNGLQNGSYGSGGGAGGSIYLTVGTLAGTGTLSANGGSGPAAGGGGGGGRIAIYRGTETFTGTQSAYGGAGLVRGGAGTIYTKGTAETVGRVRLDNGGTSGALTPVASPEAFSLTLANGAQAYPSESLTLGGLSIMTDGLLTYLDQQEEINLSVLGDAVIGVGGRISADGKGYGTGQGEGAGGAGGLGGGGGGHGGQGGGGSGSGGIAYGSLTQPTAWGSGGGRCSPVATAGSGGGAVRLSVAGVLTVDGQLSAKGTDGQSNGSYGTGGGAGGSIYLTVGTLAGTGSISANGGSGPAAGGGGGGGRIAIYSGAETFTGTPSASGGAGAVRGGAGTIYSKTDAETVGRVRLDNGGISGALTPIASPEAFSLTLANGAQAYPSESLTLGDLSITNGLLTYLFQQVGIELTVLGDAVVGPGGRLLADGKGYGTGQGAGAGGVGDVGGGGGGHGGQGGSGRGGGGGIAYGSLTQPTAWGSGGGRCSILGTAGSGGGAVRLNVAGVLTVDGQLSAKGTDGQSNGSYGTGGGAGGSIYLTVGTLAGTGTISANGGIGPSGGGGGGGGRIAIYYDTNSFTGTITAAGGAAGWLAGYPGTIHTATNATPWIIAQTPSGTVDYAVDHLDVTFSVPVNGSTFTGADVVLTTPAGTVDPALISVGKVAGQTWRISFPAQSALGNYSIQIGPHIQDLAGLEMRIAYYGGFGIQGLQISGVVRAVNGAPLSGVLVRAGADRTATTGANGGYTLIVPPGWTGQVVPTKSGCVFSPGSRAYTSLAAGVANANFALAPASQ
ncbi:MAG: carboxypeptidase-like regulatory domain-containing protein, partial [Verrucomicrobia bacterium]|nr:carboxypeptidase-like regulatory domain-containing protein [Verrucomicrobiota bacterium]